MDLKIIGNNLKKKKYRNRHKFISDVNQIVQNSSLYNDVQLNIAAGAIFECCRSEIKNFEREINILEKLINPLIDNNQVILSKYLSDINFKLKPLPESLPFLKPVKK